MHHFFTLLIFFIGFVVKTSASDFIEENEILQIEKHPEIIKSVEDEKIYLNPEFLKLSEESIIVESVDGPIRLPSLGADLNGYYVMNPKRSHWRDYYYCTRCDLLFEKDFILVCPSCGKNDRLIYKYSVYE